MEMLATNPLLGASILASLLAIVGIIVSLTAGLLILFKVYPRETGIISMATGLGIFTYLGVKYPPKEGVHEGIIQQMLTFNQGIGGLYGDITFYGAIWITAILILPVGVGITGVLRNRF